LCDVSKAALLSHSLPISVFENIYGAASLKELLAARLELADEEKYCRWLAYRGSGLVQYLFYDT
jgi:hypothetical protein